MEKFCFRGATLAVYAGSLDDFEIHEADKGALVTVLTHAALSAPVDLFREIRGEDKILSRPCALSIPRWLPACSSATAKSAG